MVLDHIERPLYYNDLYPKLSYLVKNKKLKKTVAMDKLKAQNVN